MYSVDYASATDMDVVFTPNINGTVAVVLSVREDEPAKPGEGDATMASAAQGASDEGNSGGDLHGDEQKEAAAGSKTEEAGTIVPKTTVSRGHVLASVNGVNLLTVNRYARIMELLAAAAYEQPPIRLTYVDPAVMGVDDAAEMLSLRPDNRDTYGFARTVPHLRAEKAHRRARAFRGEAVDREWHAFVKEVGGPQVLRDIKTRRVRRVKPPIPSTAATAASKGAGAAIASASAAAASAAAAAATVPTARSVDALPVTVGRYAGWERRDPASLRAAAAGTTTLTSSPYSGGASGGPPEPQDRSAAAVPPGPTAGGPAVARTGASETTAAGAAAGGGDALYNRLRALVRRGIPVAFRGGVWYELSGASDKERGSEPGYLARILAQVRGCAGQPQDAAAAETGLDPKVMKDIEKDVARTFPGHETLDSVEGQAELRTLLQAYALHNPKIGYCQSMNFISGILLLFLELEKAFWVLAVIVEEILPAEYYTRNMVDMHVDQEVFASMIKEKLPAVYASLEEKHIHLPVISLQWFLCLFVNTLPVDASLRVWDCFFLEGCTVLFRVAIALLKLQEQRILEVRR